MPTVYPIQPKFSRGELSPRLHARSDIEFWNAGLAECYNFVVMRQGGARRRMGTLFAGASKKQSASDDVRLLPFVFSNTQSYALELSNLAMRFFALGGQVMSGGVPYEIVTPWLAADLDRLQFIQSADVMYFVHPNYAPRKLSRLGETNWTLTPVVLQDGPYQRIIDSGVTVRANITGNVIGGGTAKASSETSGSEAANGFSDNANSDWMSTSVGDGWLGYSFATAKRVIGYAVKSSTQVRSFTDNTSTTGGTLTTTTFKVNGGLRAPRTWTLEGSNDAVATADLVTNWTVLDSATGEIDWGDGESRYYTFDNQTAYKHYRINVTNSNSPDRPVSINRLSLQGGGADAASVTLTASGILGVNNDTGFKATDVGRHLRFFSADAVWHWYEITGYTSATVVTARMMSPPLPSTAASSVWRLGAFSGTSGYPGAVCFFQERLVYARTNDEPQTVWGSVTGDFESFATSIPAQPDDAFSFGFGDTSPIAWLAESENLVAGTATAIRSLGPADKTKGFSATNISQGRPIFAGASEEQPVKLGDAILFSGRSRTSLRELVYSPDSGGFVAPDASILSEHLTARGIVQIATAPSPNALIWMNCDDGSLLGVTYEREQQMLAIHQHAIGGPGAIVESITTIPTADRTELWLCVRRTRADLSSFRSIEYMAADYEREPLADAHYVDCGLIYNGAPSIAVTGLGHLAGFTVDGLSDGTTQAPAVVSGGGVYTAPDAVPSGQIHVGFGYTSRLKTLPQAQGQGDGSALGRKKLITRLIVHVLETAQLGVKAGGRSLFELFQKHATRTPELFTGNRVITPMGDHWAAGGQVTLETSAPQPATVLAITPAYDTEP